jgi:endonuclease-3
MARKTKNVKNEKTRVNEICKKLFLQSPDPVTELDYISEYTFLIAVVLSAQTTDIQVNKVTSALFAKYKTIDDILNLGLEKLRDEIRTIGLYKNKAKYIIELSKILKTQCGSQIPRDRAQLEKLPGVGRKTANVILNTLFDMNTIAVDTHVLRVGNRLGLSCGKTPLKVEQELEEIIPQKYKKHISNMLVLHGRYVCKAKKPTCNDCVINDLCNWNSRIIAASSVFQTNE